MARRLSDKEALEKTEQTIEEQQQKIGELDRRLVNLESSEELASRLENQVKEARKREVELLNEMKIYHSRSEPFESGEAIVSLLKRIYGITKLSEESGIIVRSKDRAIVYASGKFCGYFGVSQELIEGKEMPNLAPIFDKFVAHPIIRLRVQVSKDKNFDFRLTPFHYPDTEKSLGAYIQINYEGNPDEKWYEIFHLHRGRDRIRTIESLASGEVIPMSV